MLRKLRNRNQQSAQILLEHILLIGVVTIALITMTPMIRRTVQSVIKVTADEIGAQKNSDQNFNSDQGYLVESSSTSQYSRRNRYRDRPGVVVKQIDETTDTSTFTITNLGFTEEN